MFNRQNSTLEDGPLDLESFFKIPKSIRQKQYEAIRAIIIDNIPINNVATIFNYKLSTLNSLIRDAKNNKIELFPEIKKGPKSRHTNSDIQNKIIELRSDNLSTTDIQVTLKSQNISISARTVERILKESGFQKLKRRTFAQLGKTVNNTLISQKAEHLDFTELKPFNVECPVAGVFFFIPYIIESGILSIIKQCHLPESSVIGAIQAGLSMLFLKLVGAKRLTHINSYEKEVSMGIFAGLTHLPGPTYINTYSCRCSESQMLRMQEEIVSSLKKQYPEFYQSEYINLDFHSIPHFGSESEMEKVWCGARGKTLKGANTVFAQDSQSNVVLYTRSDILRKEEALEVKNFVTYWKKINRDVHETLVFDCKFTNYKVINDLNEDNIKFITLRKRNAKLISTTEKVAEHLWNKVTLCIPKRKYTKVSVFEEQVTLSDCKKPLRQVTVKDHGRIKPTYIITNNHELSIEKLLEVYAKRWRIENKLAELISFFNLNALSSPIMIRIHFDILWTMIADTLYHVFAKDLKRFEKNLAPTIFRKFINIPGKVKYDGNKFEIKIRKRSHTPVLLEIDKLKTPFKVPWLNGKTVEIVWTA